MRHMTENDQKVYQAVLAGELEIDSQGRIWRVAKRGWDRWHQTVRLNKCRRVRAERQTPQGYLQVRVMWQKQRYYTGAHRLVYIHFKGEIPEGMTVNHEDGIKNHNQPTNLTLMTYSEQSRHALHVLRVGRTNQSGERNAMSKLTSDQVQAIRQRRIAGEPLNRLAAEVGVAFQTISKIARLQCWTHLGSG